jgi:hypothetical protein
MDSTLWTGTGSALTINNSDNGTTGFKPDLVWGKMRNSADRHYIFNSVTGVTKYLSSNLTDAEVTDANVVTSFNSNGFTLGTGNELNRAGGYNFVGWQWQAGQGTTTTNNVGSISSQVSVNTTAGFSIVTYTGNFVASTIGHGLGVAPSFIVCKVRNGAGFDWNSYHASLGATKFINLNSTNAAGTASSVWNNTAPTSSVFSVADNGGTNGSGNTIVAYCWAQVAGFSQFGSYTGNGSADGPFVYTGFRPNFIMFKNTTTGATNWQINDSARDTFNVMNKRLAPSTNDAEATNFNFGDFLSNGFKIRQTDQTWNRSGDDYIYACFAENPFKFSNAR